MNARKDCKLDASRHILKITVGHDAASRFNGTCAHTAEHASEPYGIAVMQRPVDLIGFRRFTAAGAEFSKLRFVFRQRMTADIDAQNLALH